MPFHASDDTSLSHISSRLASTLLAVVVMVLAIGAAASFADEPRVEPATERTKLLADWEDLEYGMFIHFGMSTFTEDEYGKTPADSQVYNPTELDVDQWIRTAKSAGMKYAVLTTKHTYGHSLWPTKADDYSVATSPVKTDVVRQFVEACRKYDVKPGFYYLLGWETKHQAVMPPREYEEFCRQQITELLTQYGPITELWLDIPWDMGVETERVLADLYALAKKLQPNCLVAMNQGRYYENYQVAPRTRTYRRKPTDGQPVTIWPRDMNNVEISLPPASGYVAKQEVNGKTYYIPLEICDTVARRWFDLEKDAINTLPTLYKVRTGCRDRNANLLLDVGPDKSGRIPEDIVARLMELKQAVDDPSLVPVNLLEGKKATASNVLNHQPKYAASNITDGLSRTCWAMDGNRKSGWLEVDLGEETTFDSSVATEGWNRVQQFAIEIPDGQGGWKAVYQGDKMGRSGRLLKFPPVTASKVRLNILRATAGPWIWDFEVYNSGKG